MTPQEIPEHNQTLEEAAAEGLAAIERAYQDAMARIASLADGDATSVESTPATGAGDAPTGRIVLKAA